MWAGAPAIVRSAVPVAAQGTMVGDPVPGRAMIWSRCDRAARMLVNVKRGGRTVRYQGPVCGPETDFTGRCELTRLPAGERVEYEVVFEDLNAKNSFSQPVAGSFKTPPRFKQAGVKLIWGGDVCGQGWGIDQSRGGMKMFETMRRADADLFVHSGDTIYADGPIMESVTLPDNTVWRNVVTPEKSKVAETLAEFRGNHRYNLLDENVRRFNASTAQVWQWDDHEVLNNWSPGKDLANDPRYSEKKIATLVGRARKAFLDYAPIRMTPGAPERVYRRIPYGPLLDVFVIDMRSYRAANNWEGQTVESAETVYLGNPQMDWLIQGLRQSKATWKVIASDMPIGIIVGDGRDAQNRPVFENSANGNGPARGRELEIARLLKAIRGVPNIVWITADTHYTAAHHYHPDRAQFKEFSPFWEFMSGPLHAGTFGPGAKDDTFGIEVAFEKHPPKGQGGLSPAAGLQFFGEIKIEGSEEMVVTLRDVAGTALYTKSLTPARSV